MAHTEIPGITDVLKITETNRGVAQVVDKYEDTYDRNEDKKVASKEHFEVTTNQYYDLATDFYEYGWGDSFHFCSMYKHESMETSMRRHVERLAQKLEIQSGDKVLDIGCGVGGPGRTVARFSGAKVEGVNINEYQVKRARILTEKAKLDHLCTYVQADFCHMPYPDAHVSRVFAVEATCHAASKHEIYGEIFRVLKPGGIFVSYEWLLTDKYDPENEKHQDIKFRIMRGNSLPDLDTIPYATQCFKDVGFEVFGKDVAMAGDKPWYEPLTFNWTIKNLRMTSLGRNLTHAILILLEMFGFAPKGSTQTHTMLCGGADALVDGGKEGIFTPAYLVVARKPQK